MTCEWNGCMSDGKYYIVKSTKPDFAPNPDHAEEYPIGYGVPRAYCSYHKSEAQARGFVVTKPN